MDLKCALCDTSIHQFNVPAAKQTRHYRTRLESEESELKFIYAQFLLQLTYACNYSVLFELITKISKCTYAKLQNICSDLILNEL